LLDSGGVPHELDTAAFAAAEQMCRAFCDCDFERFTALLHNDFTTPIERAMPAIAGARLRLLKAGAHAAILCGSGSCVAGFFENDVAAQRGRDRIQLETGEWVATTCFGSGL
jgi:4-diphosphocytidyl-2C-methyl-D-erythritol kinase